MLRQNISSTTAINLFEMRSLNMGMSKFNKLKSHDLPFFEFEYDTNKMRKVPTRVTQSSGSTDSQS